MGHVLGQCSTPFGITAYVTMGQCLMGFNEGSAQRLSASLLTSLKPQTPPARPRRRAQRLSASLLTSQASPTTSWARVLVLNAFRHHCLRHAAPIALGSAGDPVLNAFRHHCLRHSMRKRWQPARSCAQRLSASLLTSRAAARGSCADGASAQRLSASLLTSPPVRHPEWCGGSGAQRLSASLLTSHTRMVEEFASIKCSTPFGITAYVTRRHAQTSRETHGVLNAFRHHCLRHGIWAGFCVYPSRCSTPFGITAYVTREAMPGGLIDVQCSTPFGITAYVTHSLS